MYLINQHSIEVNCSKQQLGHEFNNDLSTVLELDFYPKLEKLLQDYDDENTIWSIDHLLVELNDLNAKNWKPEFVNQTLLQIERYLKEHVSKKSIKNNEVKIEETTWQITKKEYIQDLIVGFIKSGVLKTNLQTNSLQELYKKIDINTAFVKKIKVALKEEIQAILRWSLNMPKHLKFEFLGVDGVAHDLDFAIKAVDRSPKLNDFLEFLYWIVFFNKKTFKMNQSSMKAIKIIAKDYYDIEGPYVDQLLYQNGNGNETISKEKEDLITLQQDGFNVVNDEKSREDTKTKKNVSKPQDVLYIDNAGLILIHPFLSKLFLELGYQEKGKWKDVSLQHRAALLLHYLVSFNEVVFENELLLNKLLCGIPLQDTVHTEFEVTKQEKELSQSLLQSVIEHWTVLKNTSIKGLQESFIQRTAKLIIANNNQFELTIENKSYDILLDQLPWGISMIKTPWMENYLISKWR